MADKGKGGGGSFPNEAASYPADTMREKAARGQTIVSSTAPDRSTHKTSDAQEAFAGRPMKGSGTDLARSMKAGAYNDETKKGNIPL